MRPKIIWKLVKIPNLPNKRKWSKLLIKMDTLVFTGKFQVGSRANRRALRLVRKRKLFSADVKFKVNVLIFFETSSWVKMSTLILKLWYMACTIFCLYSLNKVVEERHEVAIFAKNRSETDPVILLICQELSSFQSNKRELRLEVLRDELVKHFNRPNLPKHKILSTKKILGRLKTGQYVIFNDLLCILLETEGEGVFMKKILSKAVFFAFKNSTLDFAKMSSPNCFDQLIVQRRGPPYSNCSDSNRQFRCLNECFKEKFRLSRYFYEGNETGLIHLNLEMNRTIEESERMCFEKCWRENCEIVQLTPAPESRYSKTTTLGAQPKLSEFDFWVQYVGLVCSFANFSLNQLASMTIICIALKVKRRRVRIGLFCIKWTILFLSLIYCSYLYTTMTFDHQAKKENPNKKEMTRNLIKQKTLRLAICINLKQYLTHDEDDYLAPDDDYDDDDFDINRISKTMLEIEKATDGALNDHLEGIHLNYQGRMFRVDHTPEQKVLFLSNDGVFRCFPLLIVLEYELMPSNPKLILRFKKQISFLKFYLLVENENLNEKTLEISRRIFMKRVVKRLESGGCVKSRERFENCTSRQHCIENCVNKEALKKFKKILINNAVIDKDQFSSEEWRMAHPREILGDDTDLNTYNMIYNGCEKKFQVKSPCLEIAFKEMAGIIPADLKTKEIDLFLDVELSIEEFSWFKLLLDILTIQSIFFGITVLKLLRMLYRLFKSTLKNDKTVKLFIYLLCSLGFTYHTYRILELAINEELTYSQDYEVASRVRMPVVVFCLPINEKLVDRNHLLTGNYLEQVTSEMTSESVFESILYLNESNKWIPFNLSLVERFFFMHSKCFRITIHRDYERRQFHFSTNSLVFKMNFTDRFLNERRTVFFMTKTNETEFSNVVDLVYKSVSETTRNRYLVEQSEYTVKYEDHLSFFKRFLTTSYKDDFDGLGGQLPEMKSNEFSFKTLKVPIEKEDFGCDLQNDLFDQLSIQIKAETIHNVLDSNYSQIFVFNYLKEVIDTNSDLTLSLALIKKTFFAKNDELAKFVLNLLNVLFIWYDLGPLDLHPIFILTHDYLLIYLYLHWPIYLLNKITQFVIFGRRWLKKFERPLYIRLNARRLRVPRFRQFYFKPVGQASSS